MKENDVKKFDFEKALDLALTAEDIKLLREKVEIKKVYEEAEAIRKKADAEVAMKEVESKNMTRKTDSELETEETKRSKMGKITGKDIVAMIPQVVAVAAGIFTIVSSIQQTNRRCATDVAITAMNNETKTRLTNNLTKYNESEVLIDKPIKVYNEIGK